MLCLFAFLVDVVSEVNKLISFRILSNKFLYCYVFRMFFYKKYENYSGSKQAGIFLSHPVIDL